MLPHNSDRLGSVHGASHRRETELWQEHEHRVNEGRVVVDDDDTSVPLKRHFILQSLSGRDAGVRYVRLRQTATGERRARRDHMRSSRGRQGLQIMEPERACRQTPKRPFAAERVRARKAGPHLVLPSAHLASAIARWTGVSYRRRIRHTPAVVGVLGTDDLWVIRGSPRRQRVRAGCRMALAEMWNPSGRSARRVSSFCLEPVERSPADRRGL
jgi:hypothetical protein